MINLAGFKSGMYAQEPLFGGEIGLGEMREGMHGILFVGGVCRGAFGIVRRGKKLWAVEKSRCPPLEQIDLSAADNPLLKVTVN